jgi:hypothetical protein
MPVHDRGRYPRPPVPDAARAPRFKRAARPSRPCGRYAPAGSSPRGSSWWRRGYRAPWYRAGKVSVATTLKHSKGGQFVVHAQALPGNPYDGHTLAGVIPAIEQLVGNTIERLHADAGYRGHNAPPEYKFKIYTSKQKRRVTPQIKRER